MRVRDEGGDEDRAGDADEDGGGDGHGDGRGDGHGDAHGDEHGVGGCGTTARFDTTLAAAPGHPSMRPGTTEVPKRSQM